MTLPGLSAARSALFRARYRVEARLRPYRRREIDIHYVDRRSGAPVDLQMRVRLYSPVDLLGRRDAAGRTALDGTEILGGNPGWVRLENLHYLPTDSGKVHSALYDAAGRRAPGSLTLRGAAREPVCRTHPPAGAAGGGRIEARPSIYLGHLHNHFGHVVTETLSRLWIFREHDPRDFNLVFHAKRFAFPAWMLELFELAGLPAANVSIYETPTLIRDVIIPRQAVILHACIWQDYLEVMARIGARIDHELPGLAPGQPVYLSREKLDPARRIVHEAELTRQLSTRGCRIVYPELLTVRGSAFHTNLFATAPLRNIYIGPLLDRSFLLFDAARNHDAAWIFAHPSARRDGTAPVHHSAAIDVRQCLRALEQEGI